MSRLRARVATIVMAPVRAVAALLRALLGLVRRAGSGFRRRAAGPAARAASRWRNLSWRPTTEQVSIAVALLALTVSIWTATGGNSRVDRAREDELRSRLRDNMARLGELDIQLRGDAESAQAASMELAVRALDSWEIITELGARRVSLVDISMTAHSLATSGMRDKAAEAITQARAVEAPQDIRLVVLNSAVPVYYQTGDLVALRSAAQEAIAIEQDRLRRQRATGNAYAALGPMPEARTRLVWAASEAMFRSCDQARTQRDLAHRLLTSVPPAQVALLRAYQQESDRTWSDNCTGAPSPTPSAG